MEIRKERSMHGYQKEDLEAEKLCEACRNGDLDLIRQLVPKTGLGPEVRNWIGDTPLQCAAATGQLQVIEYLLQNGVPAEGRDGNIALGLAIASSHNAVVIKLMRANPNLKPSLTVNNEPRDACSVCCQGGILGFFVLKPGQEHAPKADENFIVTEVVDPPPDAEIDDESSGKVAPTGMNVMSPSQACLQTQMLHDKAIKAGEEAERFKAEKAEAERIAAEKAEAERIAAEKAEAERIAAEKAEAERIAAEKAEAERIAAEKAEAERIAAEKAEAERIAAEKAEAERIAAEKAEAERIAAEKAEAERIAAEKAEAERIAAEKAEAERIAAEKAEAERIAAEKAEAERIAAEKAEAERIAAEKAEAERIAAEKAEAERIAAEKAEAERIAAEKAEAERIAAEKAEAERLAAEKAEAERIAAGKAEAERIAAEKAEAERIAAEKAEVERIAAEKAEAERIAAEKAEAERIAAEKAEAERIAAEEIEAKKLAETKEDFARFSILRNVGIEGMTESQRRSYRTHMVDVNSDVTCKQLLVANRAELFHIFNCYMDNSRKAVLRANVHLFAVNFRLVPEFTSRRKLDTVIDELVMILNEDRHNKENISKKDAPLTFISFLKMLVLLSRSIIADGDENSHDHSMVGRNLDRILRHIDTCGGKQKMGGDLSRNSFTSGTMVYTDSNRLPNQETAMNFNLQQWLQDNHIRAKRSFRQRTPRSSSRRSSIPVKSRQPGEA